MNIAFAADGIKAYGRTVRYMRYHQWQSNVGSKLAGLR